MFDAIPQPGAGAALNGELLPQGMPAMPDMDGLLRDFALQNPSLAWVTQMIAAQRQFAATATPVLDVVQPQDELDALSEELAHAQARADKLQRIARRLANELEAAQERLADLAAAFGACGLCWGEDTRCPSCRGRGKPGRFAPDPELRLRFFAEPLEASVASRTSTHPDQVKGDES
ncbi:MAG TPA: hypothetical protein VGQ93_10700 [Lysobacter sp.]|jgi:hypothetical protein|nr:hypothetical protein [Lysobacter sp.]